MEQFSKRIYYTMHDDENDQPYLFLILGDKYTLQVDAGNSPRCVKQFHLEREALGLPKPDFLVLTHWHWDHSFGLCAIDYPTFSSQKTYDKLEQVKTWVWNDQEMKKRLEEGLDIEFCFEKMHVEYQPIEDVVVKNVDITFTDRLSFDLGGVTCECIHHNSPHTRDAVFIYIPEERVLIGGDAEYEDYYDNNSQYDPKYVLEMISFLESLDFDYYLRGHDEVSLTKKEILDKMNEAYKASNKEEYR